MTEFNNKFKNAAIEGVEFRAEILTNGHWPEQQ